MEMADIEEGFLQRGWVGGFEKKFEF